MIKKYRLLYKSGAEAVFTINSTPELFEDTDRKLLDGLSHDNCGQIITFGNPGQNLRFIRIDDLTSAEVTLIEE